MEEIKNNIPQENTSENVPEKIVNVSNPTVEVIKKKDKANKGMMIVIFILLLAVIALGTYILVREGYFSEEETTNVPKNDEQIEPKEKETEIEEETVKEPELVKFEGEYLYAEVPQGWSVKEFEEFFDENGRKLEISELGLLEYIGLASVKIYKENSELLKLSPFFGGVGTLDFGTMYRFKDYSPEWEKQEATDYKKVGGTIEIIDLTKTPYSEYKILGATVRRVSEKFFQDQVETTTTFECYASAPILYSIRKFPCSSPSEGIGYKFAEGITEPDLLIIDKILQSLKPNCSN